MSWIQKLMSIPDDDMPLERSVRSQWTSLHNNYIRMRSTGKKQDIEEFNKTIYTIPKKKTPVVTKDQTQASNRDVPTPGKSEIEKLTVSLTDVYNKLSNASCEIERLICENSTYEEKARKYERLHKDFVTKCNSLADLKGKLAMMNTRNINHKLKRKGEKIDGLKKILCEKDEHIVQLKEENTAANQEIDKLNQNLMEFLQKRLKDQKMKSYYKTKSKIINDDTTGQQCRELEKENLNLNAIIEDLTAQLDEKLKQKVKLFNDGKYDDNIRTVYIDLMRMGVSISNCNFVVESVLKNILAIDVDRLPKKSLASLLSIEASILAQAQAASIMLDNQHNTLHLDGTKKHFTEYSGFQVSTNDGSYSLGLQEMATGSAEKYLASTQDTLHEMAEAFVGPRSEEQVEETEAKLLMSVKNIMTDRHVVNKSYKKLLVTDKGDAIDNITESRNLPSNVKDDLCSVNALFCSLHILPNMATAALNGMKSFEKMKDVHRKSGYPTNNSIGHDLIHQVCKAFIPTTCDQKSGDALEFHDFLKDMGQKCHLLTFLHNRFNVLFLDGGAVFHCSSHIHEYLSSGRCSKSNKLIATISAHIDVPALLAECRALGIVGKLITTPLFHILEDRSLHYFDKNTHWSHLYDSICLFSEDSTPLLKGTPVFNIPEETYQIHDEMFTSLFTENAISDPLTKDALQELCKSIAPMLKRQLADVLPGGGMNLPSQQFLLETQSAPKTNKISEADFSDLDRITKAAPQKSTVSKSGIILFTKNKTASFLRTISNQKRAKYMKIARNLAIRRAKQHTQRVHVLQQHRLSIQRERADAKIRKEERSKEYKEKLETQMKKEGVWTNQDEITSAMRQQTLQGGKRLVKNQILFHLHLLNSNISNKKSTKFQKDGKQFACQSPAYGQDCASACDNCDGGACHHVTGSCDLGCLPGWEGTLCTDACQSPAYGQDCVSACDNCIGGACHHVTGSCDLGCLPGWEGTLCTDACQSPAYGQDCASACDNCGGGACHHVTGSCDLGCLPGWEGTLCTDACQVPKYGQDCASTCDNCDGGSCHHVTGSCDQGCTPGWFGSYCNQACQSPAYGQNCTSTCDNCVGGVCDHVTGSCDHGCVLGWQGTHCTDACQSPAYGQNCASTCDNCDGGTCHHVTGSCDHGCVPGWEGSHCTDACQSPSYGQDCASTCDNCDGGPCHHVTGSCEQGCVPGWKGTLCTDACQSPAYGQNCASTCDNCDGGTCHHVTGSCDHGCVPGWEGSHCTDACQSPSYGQDCASTCDNCAGGPCHHVTGSCEQGCVPGWKGTHCTDACQPPTYGEDCASLCYNCDSLACHHVTGACDQGCVPGWEGTHCTDACRSPAYGQNCASTCDTCVGGLCDHVIGSCDQGCVPGWEGFYCINACQVPKYGQDCASTCDNCDGGSCHHMTGSCDQGCTPGWFGSYCNQACQSPAYGQNCTSTCDNCVGGVCDHVTGSCDHGCVLGWQGTHCTDACQSPAYGQNCASTCDNCNGGTCHHATGSCDHGCVPGWKGSQCTDACQSPSYGQDCASTCDNCAGGPCHHVTGSCEQGCVPGWKGTLCTDACQVPKYGQDCASTCDNCDGGSCHHVTGSCDQGCTPGWFGSYCNQACQVPKYGQDCASTCDNCDGGCHHVTGSCDQGCIPGWEGTHCTNACQSPFYGQDCASSCDNCHKGTCHHVTGSCDQGCVPGWRGTNCLNVCQQPTYGQDCASTCDNCDGGMCHHVTGSCDHGCTPGWFGSYCNQVCRSPTYGQDCASTCDNCAGGACHHVTGSCEQGCVPGWLGANCTNACQLPTYGQDCISTCDNCAGGTCHHVTGSCDQGCVPGWEGTHCTDACRSPNYGLACSEVCFTCDGGSCNHVTGSCDSGCIPGWKGSFCDDSCEFPMYGQNCSSICDTCTAGVCHYETGECLQGCNPGWTGPFCNNACQNPAYGQDCSSSCDHCYELLCDHVTGFCEQACSMGYFGPKCDQKCQPPTFGQDCASNCSTCVGSACHYITGSCDLGCIPGWEGEFCAIPCESPFYGQNCMFRCPDGCEQSLCDFVTGHCNLPCGLALMGPFCNESCPDGMYGAGCRQTCGNCIDMLPCDHYTGHCHTGCIMGYQQPLCTEESELYLFTSNHVPNGNYGWILIATDAVSTETIVTFSIDYLVCKLPLDYTPAAQVLKDPSVITANNISAWGKFISANLTSAMPTFIASYQFLEEGLTRVVATVKNGNVSTTKSSEVSVNATVEQNCLKWMVMLNAGKEASSRTTFLRSRKTLLVVHLVDLLEDCENVMITGYEWAMIEEAWFCHRPDLLQMIPLPDTMDLTLDSLLIPSNVLPYGNHTVKVNVYVRGRMNVTRSIYGYIQIVDSPLVAVISGELSIIIPWSQPLNIDASQSHDPDGMDTFENFILHWSCEDSQGGACTFLNKSDSDNGTTKELDFTGNFHFLLNPLPFEELCIGIYC
ncbi:hypothetical protein ScPMuIL_001519 [Solemya velum]